MKGKQKSTIIAAAALAVLTACGPKKAFNPSKNPLSENKPLPVLFSEWGRGACSLNKPDEKVSYKDKEGVLINYFDVSKTENVSKIHCSEEKTVLISNNCISVYDLGGIPGLEEINENMLAFLQSGFGPAVELEHNSRTIANEKNEVNIASVSSGNEVFVLARNTETDELSVTKISLGYGGSADRFLLGKLFGGEVDIAAENGILLMAGEAVKGEDYLIAFKFNGQAVGIPFRAKKELKGEVKFGSEYNQAEKILTLEIGQNKFYIELEISETELEGFEDMGDKTFAKIKITK